MKYSKVIAISAISSAFALIFIVLGAWVEVLDLSCLFLSSIALMLPLAKGYRLGGFLAYLSTGIIALIFVGPRFPILIPYALFFGLHPLANDLQKKYHINNILATIIKAVWFVLTLYAMYYFTTIFLVENEFIKKYIHYFIIIGGVLVFIVYDFLMNYFQKAVNMIVKKLKL